MSRIKWYEFTLAAAEAAAEALCWSETEYDDDGQEVGNYSDADLAEVAHMEILQDMTSFLHDDMVRDAIKALSLTAEEIGHNFYLSANGHGTGFWDRGWGEKGDILHNETKAYPRYLYRGDDGLVYT